MDIRFRTTTHLAAHPAELLVVPVFEGANGAELPDLSGELAERLRGQVEPADLRSAVGRSTLAYPGVDGGPRRVLLAGVGKPDDLTAEGWRRYAGTAVRAAEKQGVESLAIVAVAGAETAERTAQAVAEACALAVWRFRELKTGATEDEAPPAVGSVEIVMAAEHEDAGRRGVHAGGCVAEGANVARALQDRPGNVATPTHLAEEAVRLASETGMGATILGPEELRAENMHALLAVSQGSIQEPRLIVLEHRGGDEDEAPLVLVGKGLTFDAGGISIKPAKGMEEMKYDMSGGAAVIGAMVSIARLEVPRNVVGIVPSSENLLDGGAVKPGDIISSRSGKTIEVVNTDAEGRLILCDALDYARELEPAAMVDCATLTGSVIIALGHHAAALMGTDDALMDELKQAGEVSGERCWPLPLWKEYRKQLDSDAADLVNVGGRPGGSITAAAFLREFVGDVPWAHLDIAGTAWGSEPRPYLRRGGFGFPTRLLVEWVRSRAE